MSTQQKHLHKLKRLKYKSGNVSFFCILDCSYKISQALALGKQTICWRCGKPFTMTEYSLRLAKPHCEACHKPKGVSDKLDDILNKSDDSKNYISKNEMELSLSERLSLTIHQAQKQEEDEI